MILALNGSPRSEAKNGNTATMLRAILDGAAAEGLEGRLIELYPLKYKGCISCFSCKRKGGKLGCCAMKDELSPVLDMMDEADALVFGSPIYYSDITPEMLALLHRFLFSHMLYNKVDRWLLKRLVPSAFVYTFGAPPEMTKTILDRFNVIHGCMGDLLGLPADVCYSANAWQFTDYSLYEADMFDPVAKKKYREEVFPEDCRKAFELGRVLARKSRDVKAS